MRIFASVAVLFASVVGGQPPAVGPVGEVPVQAQPEAVSKRDAERAELLKGVEGLPPVGTVGQVAVWGKDAFAVVVGGVGKERVPIVAVGKLGKGYVAAWAHGYGTKGAAEKAGVGELLRNMVQWMGSGGQMAKVPNGQSAKSEKGGVLRVGTLESDLAEWIASQEMGGRKVSGAKVGGGDAIGEQLKDVDVLLCMKTDLSAREVEAITKFVEGGGGFVCFSCPWGWAQTHHKAVVEEPLNRVLAPAGIALADGYAEAGNDGKFEAKVMPGAEFNATRAFEILAEASAGKRKAGDAEVKQAGFTAVAVVRSMGREDRILRPRLMRMLAEHSAGLVPTEKSPLTEAQALERALLALQVDELKDAKPEQVKAHPAAKTFPGEPEAGARRVTTKVEVDLSVPGWHSTGLYAAAGQVVTVTGEGSDFEKQKLSVRIGCHTDHLWDHAAWKRVPEITGEWAMTGQSLKVASAFGGLVYIDVPGGKTGLASLTIAGAVEAPLFVLGKTTDAQWTQIRGRPGPWAELASDSVILTIPTSVARTVDNPTAIMEHWMKVLAADAELAGIPAKRVRPERYVADVEISAGYMHSGYPIMTHLDAATFMTNLKGLTDSGWGPYHEMGHNHQDGMWTFEGTTEVTCNLFTMYVLETVCGVKDVETGRVLNDDGTRARLKYLAEGAKFEKWKSDPFLALQMYAMIKREFGWGVYKKVFAEYRGLKAGERPKGDGEARDQWMVRMSRAVGRNLGPFFEKWGVPTSQGARDSVKELAVWMPEEMR